MDIQKTPVSRAFFLELLLTFAIFALCTVICLQVFAEADVQSERSAAITKLSIQAQDVAETFKATGGDIVALNSDTGAVQSGSELFWYYDEDLNVVESDAAYFVLRCQVDDSSDLKVATITLTEEGDIELFKFNVSRYLGSEVVS